MSGKKRSVHFDVELPLMFHNDGCLDDSDKKKMQKDEELERIQRENKRLKAQLVRKWSSRSTSSLGIPSNSAYYKDEEDEEPEDESYVLFRDNTTLHGLRDLLTSPSNAFRAIWIVVLIIASLLALHGCWEIYLEFKLRRVVVSYFIQQTNKLMLPDIVICPFNRFNRSYLEQWNVSEGLAQHLEMSYPLDARHPIFDRAIEETKLNIDRYEYELELLMERVGNKTFAQFLNEASLDCKAFFVDEQRCEEIQEIMTSAGKCFRLEGFEQRIGGFGYGESVVIRLPTHLYNPGVNQLLNDGIALKLVPHGKGIDNDLTFIPSGVHVIMPLTATKYEFMNDPPRYECENDPIGTYSRVRCFELCLTEEAEDKCNCSLTTTSKMRKADFCTTKHVHHCIMPIVLDSLTREDCISSCKPPCSYWHYEKTVSYAKFPGEVARHFVQNNSDWRELESSIILEIFFTNLEYTTIKHVVAMPLQSVIAQIGGQFSLWAGGSLISLFQIVIYLLRFCCDSCKRKRSNRSKRKPKKTREDTPQAPDTSEPERDEEESVTV